MIDTTSSNLFPLTLAEGEFIFQEPGLSVNRRNPFVNWNTEGIYYERAGDQELYKRLSPRRKP